MVETSTVFIIYCEYHLCPLVSHRQYVAKVTQFEEMRNLSKSTQL